MTDPLLKIAFVSPHCVLDFTNGAATATRDGLRLLAEHGFECQAFCGTRLDDAQEGLLQESLFRRGVRYEVRKVKIPRPPGIQAASAKQTNSAKQTPSPRQTLSAKPKSTGIQTSSPPAPLPPSTAGEGRYYDARLLFTVDGNLPVTVFENASTRGGWLNVQEAQAYLTACDIFLRKNRPDVVWTYGGDPVSIAVQRLAKRLGIYVLFALHNFSYFDRAAFEHVDCITVPAEFSRRYYREKLGIECRVLPNIVNWKAAEVSGKGLWAGYPVPPGGSRLGETSGGSGASAQKHMPSPPAPLPEYRARGD